MTSRNSSYTIFSLQEIYELQNSSRLSERMCLGRLFYQDEQFGIEDYSGRFWPIVFETNHSVKSGDVIQFHGRFIDNICHIQMILSTVHTLIEPVEDLKKLSSARVVMGFKSTNENENFKCTTVHSDKIERLNKRNLAIERTKQFFENRGFFYAETPILVPSGGMETYLHTFQTTYRDYHGREWTFELPTSPEFALKKLLAQGFPKIFQISHAFRNNGELSPLHEPEFLMLEWYRAGSTLADVMDDTRKLVLELAHTLNSKKNIPKRWPTFQVRDLFIEKLQLNLDELQNTKDFYENAQHLSSSLRSTDSWDDIFCKLFMEKIEPFLKQHVACFVTGYPAQMSALATNDTNNPLFVQRTEAYLFGIEICNGYQELVDAQEFQQRLNKIQKQKSGQIQRDIAFENAMKLGLPPCAGNAVGIDRIIALLLDLKEIQPLFPLPFAYT